LGLPLHFRHLRKVHLQPPIDKIAAKLPGWMGKNLARPGRITLAKTVLMATADHAMVFPLSKWARLKTVRISRRFVRAGDAGEHDACGHALVNWKTVCRPKDLGGLGIPDQDRCGRALRLRWLSLKWTDPTQPWSGSKLLCSDADRALFRAYTKIELADGEKTSFWHDKWCDRGPLQPGRQTFTRLQPEKRDQSQRWSRAITRYVLLQDWTRLFSFPNIWRLGTSSQPYSWRLTSPSPCPICGKPPSLRGAEDLECLCWAQMQDLRLAGGAWKVTHRWYVGR
jgi:hypothetical protein